MYCPNCGTKQSAPRPAACDNCQLPLASVNQLLDDNKAAIQLYAEQSRASRDKMIAVGTFALLAAAPIAVGLKNSLSAKPAKN